MQKKSPLVTTLAFCFAVLFSSTLAFSLFAYNIEKQVFNPVTYKQALINQNFCQRMPSILAAQLDQYIQSKSDQPLLGQLFGSLDAQTVQSLVSTLLPCESVQNAMFKGIDFFFGAINAQTAPADFSIESIKEGLTTQSQQVVNSFYDSLPPCTTEDILALGSGLVFGDTKDLKLCKPPEVFRELIIGPLKAVMDNFINGLPGEVQLFNNKLDIEKIAMQFRIMRIVFRWSFIVPLIAFIVLSLLAIRKWRDILLWWGLPILAGGLMALVASALAAPLTEIIIRNILLPVLPINLVPQAMDLIANVIAEVASGVTAPIILQALFFTVAGAGLVATEVILQYAAKTQKTVPQ
jgi:hypothetical protein